jgi:hypothetical protein
MTPPEFADFIKALGVPGGVAVAALYLWMTRTPAKPGKSELEEDIKAIRDAQKEMQSDLKALRAEVSSARERIAKMEGKLG